LPVAQNPATQTPDAGIDPVTGLHRMSYIAGLGTHDYQSVNLPAVVALVLGVASCLSLIWGWMVVIPVGGVACGLTAVIQIRRSNGTQTGSTVAWIGVALSGLFVVIAGGQKVIEDRQLALEGQRISALCQEWGQDITAGQYEKAYKLYSDRFTDKVSLDEFKANLQYVQSNTITGPIAKAEWNGLAQFDSDSTTGITKASGMVVITYQKGMSDRWATFFRLSNGHWQFDSMPDVFTEQKAPR
jgi:hypothetical protein